MVGGEHDDVAARRARKAARSTDPDGSHGRNGVSTSSCIHSCTRSSASSEATTRHSVGAHASPSSSSRW